MGDVIPLRKPGPGPRKSGGSTLCRRGFHKWAIDHTQRFDVKQGRLVTVRRCERCGLSRTSLD